MSQGGSEFYERLAVIGVFTLLVKSLQSFYIHITAVHVHLNSKKCDDLPIQCDPGPRQLTTTLQSCQGTNQRAASDIHAAVYGRRKSTAFRMHGWHPTWATGVPSWPAETSLGRQDLCHSWHMTCLEGAQSRGPSSRICPGRLGLVRRRSLPGNRPLQQPMGRDETATWLINLRCMLVRRY